jgi:hypothetical protein
MAYAVRHKDPKGKWLETVDPYPPQVTQWLDTVEAKIVEMFGANPSGEYTYDQDSAATAALAADGVFPPSDVEEWLNRPLEACLAEQWT